MVPKSVCRCLWHLHLTVKTLDILHFLFSSSWFALQPLEIVQILWSRLQVISTVLTPVQTLCTLIMIPRQRCLFYSEIYHLLYNLCRRWKCNNSFHSLRHHGVVGVWTSSFHSADVEYFLPVDFWHLVGLFRWWKHCRRSDRRLKLLLPTSTPFKTLPKLIRISMSTFALSLKILILRMHSPSSLSEQIFLIAPRWNLLNALLSIHIDFQTLAHIESWLFHSCKPLIYVLLLYDFLRTWIFPPFFHTWQTHPYHPPKVPHLKALHQMLFDVIFPLPLQHVCLSTSLPGIFWLL